MRAISRFASFSRAGFSSAPVADWKRRLNSSCLRSASAFSSSSFDISLIWLALKETRLSFHKLRSQRQLRACQAKRFLRERLGHTGELEHDAPGLDDGDPVLGRALAGAHPRLRRLLGDRLVWKDVDPDLAAALDLARHGDSGSLDLAVCDPARLQRLDPEVAELHGGLPFRKAAAPAALVLAELGLLREQHGLRVPLLLALRARGLGRLVARLVQLRWILDLGLLRRRLRRLGDSLRRRRRLRLDLRQLAALGRHRLLVGARLLDRSSRTAATARTAPRPAVAHGAEPLAIRAPAAATLARGAEALGAAAAPPGLILIAEACVAASVDRLEALGHDLALVDPDLDADPAVGRLRLDEAVVDVGADRVQRDAALGVGLGATHLAAAQPARARDLDAVRAGADRGGERALHRAAEGHAVRQLLGDRLGDELRVELGPLDLVDVDVDVLVRECVQVAAQRVHLGA